MGRDVFSLIERLEHEHRLETREYQRLIEERTEPAAQILAEKAARTRDRVYGKTVYIRGLIEFTNYCRNDCLYCGIRRSNPNLHRYRLTENEILSCCENGYRLGFRTFVLQGGEDPYFTDEILGGIICEIKARYPDCCVTLSVGERSRESYHKLFRAGAERYLLRHETVSEEHYRMLHPPELSWQHRMDCLQALRDEGFQVGSGFMVGSPGQTAEILAREMKFIETFRPDMCGIGPFIPHHDTPFADRPAGTLELTCYLLSLIRLIEPEVLLPATTALGTIDPTGREKGIRAGANVVMPNLSPGDVRGDYALYDNKIGIEDDAKAGRIDLENRVRAAGCRIEIGRGDVRKGKDGRADGTQ